MDNINSRARCDDTRLLVEDCRASIVCLQETKLDVVTNAFMLRLLGVQFTDFAYLPASDTRGDCRSPGNRLHLGRTRRLFLADSACANSG